MNGKSNEILEFYRICITYLFCIVLFLGGIWILYINIPYQDIFIYFLGGFMVISSLLTIIWFTIAIYKEHNYYKKHRW